MSPIGPPSPPGLSRAGLGLSGVTGGLHQLMHSLASPLARSIIGTGGHWSPSQPPPQPNAATGAPLPPVSIAAPSPSSALPGAPPAPASATPGTGHPPPPGGLPGPAGLPSGVPAMLTAGAPGLVSTVAGTLGQALATLTQALPAASATVSQAPGTPTPTGGLPASLAQGLPAGMSAASAALLPAALAPPRAGLATPLATPLPGASPAASARPGLPVAAALPHAPGATGNPGALPLHASAVPGQATSASGAPHMSAGPSPPAAYAASAAAASGHTTGVASGAISHSPSIHNTGIPAPLPAHTATGEARGATMLAGGERGRAEGVAQGHTLAQPPARLRIGRAGLGTLLAALGGTRHTGAGVTGSPERQADRAFQRLYWTLTLVAYACLAVAVLVFLPVFMFDTPVADGPHHRSALWLGGLGLLGLCTGVAAWRLATRHARADASAPPGK